MTIHIALPDYQQKLGFIIQMLGGNTVWTRLQKRHPIGYGLWIFLLSKEINIVISRSEFEYLDNLD